MAYSPWDMLSAVGTLAAIAVALGVSGHAAWANRKVEEDRSELAAARMLNPLLALERKGAYLSICFAFSESDFAESGANVLTALSELEAMSKAISVEDLYPLLKLPSHTAKRSAWALGLIQAFTTDACALLAHHSWVDLKISHKLFHYKRWFGMLSEIHDHLTVAVAACESAASIGAPRPSPEEMYGGPTNY